MSPQRHRSAQQLLIMTSNSASDNRHPVSDRGQSRAVCVVIRVLVARAPGGAQVLSAGGGRPGRPPAGCKRVGGSPLASLGVHGAGRLCGPGRPLPRGLHTVLAPGLNRAGASPGPPYYALSIRRLRQSATLTQHTHKHGGREYYTRSE